MSGGTPLSGLRSRVEGRTAERGEEISVQISGGDSTATQPRVRAQTQLLHVPSDSYTNQ